MIFIKLRERIGMKKALFGIIFVLMFIGQGVYSVTPQKWILESFDDFIKGKFEGITVSSDGKLTLSPVEEVLKAPPEEFYLSLLVTPERTIYIGTGHKGAVYRMEPNGEPELYFRSPEMDVTCLVLGPDGSLYAGTSPNGKVYKITKKGNGDEFFNPHEKYIWDLMFTPEGSLLAAVGEDGGIYEISPNGEGVKVFDSEENHILCMKWISDESFIAGSGGDGMLYKISKEKIVSVIFESPYEEIRTIALDDEGYIFVGAGGEVKESENNLPSTFPTSDTNVAITVSASGTGAKKIAKADGDQPSALYKIKEDGKAKQLWKSDKDMIYSLCWDGSKERIVFGTGKRGRLYTLDKDENVSLLFQKDSEQIYFLLPLKKDIYTLSNNPSEATVIQPEQRYNGEYISRVYDAKLMSSWGKIEWKGETPSGTVVQLQTRTGNSKRPSPTWSNWSPPYLKKKGEQILNPDARYLQFKILFKTDSGNISPEVQKVIIFSQQHNTAPHIKQISILPPNTVYIEPPSSEEKIWGLASDSLEQETKQKSFVGAKKVQRKGFQTIVWQSEDKNNDTLIYSIFIKKPEENKWRTLKEKWTEKIFTFDTLSLPNGEYKLKVAVSDEPSNPGEKSLEHEKISKSLTIDNSVPDIKNFQAVRSGNKLKVQFTVQDEYSRIEKVRYFIRDLGWKVIFPEDGICDSVTEVFQFSINLPENIDDMITVKAVDEQGNVGVARTSF